ncbi:alkaline shock response membrane anchor protein AmaP [Caloramator sp. Dgby_cultured_2]|uniref:alkaline shock response membrane anchor protein AmaP n=1 Tax=Caloramator sp. Dgby_cultured_2 TaxID=3029174 RepID=UPI00237E016F|nr:alkaline shock response membrane anchor protein AmaP [Caloramator sp. Dgby_cultured_2]WDU84272.1 alkaline shock response membrane anchor protein AmaP [Caloramator sp. Dgby_cultured_2]
MNILNKFFLFFYLIITSILAFVVGLMPLNILSNDFIVSFVKEANKNFYVTIFAFVVLVINLIVLLNLFKRENFKLGVSRYTSEGELIISNEAIKALISKSLSDVKGLKDFKVFLKPNKDKLSVMIKAIVFPDHNIPNLVLQVQTATKTYLESVAEIPVAEVKVIVDEIASNTKLRME